MMKVTTLGIDLAKSVFQLHGVDARGVVMLRKQLRRKQMLPFLTKRVPCLVGMEACAGSHYWAREITKLGHQVRLMSPHLVAPYVKSNKNDRNHAEAICEAVSRPSMRFVPVKSTAQQDLQSLHRVRSQLIHSRTALANEIRSLLGEYGITIAKELRVLRRALPLILEDQDNGLSGVFRETLAEMMERLRFLDERIGTYEQRVKRLFDQDERCQRLADIQGVGPLIATALVAAVANAREFRSGRELSAWLGLVPRQQSSGGRSVLLGITKRGDRYLRMLLIHGARAAGRYAEGRTDPSGVWISRLKARRGPNVAAVAVANKNARFAWKLLSSGEHYLPLPPRPRDRTDIGARAPRAPLGHRTGRRGALRVATDPKPADFPPPSKSLRGQAENPL
jgi:transposase